LEAQRLVEQKTLDCINRKVKLGYGEVDCDAERPDSVR
jgi:hypothetical protein